MTSMGRFIELTASDGFQSRRVSRRSPRKRRAAVSSSPRKSSASTPHPERLRRLCRRRLCRDRAGAVRPLRARRRPRLHGAGHREGARTEGDGSSSTSTLRDVAAARDAVADAGKVGVVGYCWGGYVAWMAASRLPGFACAVSVLRRRDSGCDRRGAALPGDGAFRRTRCDDSRRRRASARWRRIRTREIFVYAADHGVQLRCAGVVRRNRGEARARAHAAVPPAVHRIALRTAATRPRAPPCPQVAPPPAYRAPRSPHDRTTARARRRARRGPSPAPTRDLRA